MGLLQMRLLLRYSLVQGQQQKKRQASLQFMGVGNKTKPEGKANKSVVEMLRKTPEEIVDERLSGSYQPTIVSSTKTKEEKHYVDTQWSLFFYECSSSKTISDCS